MLFEDFTTGLWTILWVAFGISVVLGAVVNKTNFCTMGAVSDWVNMGDTGRLRAWFLAATVAMIGVILFEYLELINNIEAPEEAVNLDSSLPPYRATAGGEFMWGRFLIGGFLFGIGMTFASGCGNKTLIRIGGGNIKSIFVFVIIAFIAFNMVDPYKTMEATWYQSYFGWLNTLSFSMDSQADLGSVISHSVNTWGIEPEVVKKMVEGKEVTETLPVVPVNRIDPVTTRFYAGLAVGLVLLFIIFKSKDFRSSFDNILAGVVIGLLVIFAFYLTSSKVNYEDESYKLTTFVTDNFELYADDKYDADVEAAEAAGVDPESVTKVVAPANANTNLLPTSFTFISPIGQVWGYTFAGVIKEGKSAFDSSFLTFGVMSVFGVILGSLLWSLLSRSFRIEWFASFKDFYMHVIGAILMGFGGVLGLGCTVGQAITGFSTMAFGAYLTFAAIIFGSALTMKIQYYKLVYEEEATFFGALITALVDFKMLPGKLRKLEAI